jgi:hypothetical protein
MNARTAPAPKASKSKELAETEADLKCEAAAIEKLRVQLSAQGASADKKQVAEFAKRQKAYLDRKIDFEKLKRSSDTGTPEPAKAKPSTPELVKPTPEPSLKQKSDHAVPAPKKTAPEKAAPQKVAPAIRETAPIKESAKPQKSHTSRAKPHARTTEKSSARWIFWLLLAAAVGLIAWLMR